ncbi:MAG: TetR/AcrR family transcriptional regulator [Clostridiales bacterium]|nr:TetR/AcrR family transcriptional regulator [Clostridiales bacterium]
MNKQPEVTEKTRQNFTDAFWSLIKEKPISKITVSEITRRAGYNRSTFYEYFLDTNDLLKFIEDKLLEKLKETVLNASSENKSPEALFQIIFAAMNEELYLLIGENGDSGFLAKARNELFTIVGSYFPNLKNTDNFDYLTCFVSSAMFGLMQHWNEKGKDIDTLKMSEIMQNLVLNGLHTYITPNLSDKSEVIIP